MVVPRIGLCAIAQHNHLDFSKRQFHSLVVNELKIDVKTSMMGALEAVYDDENDDFNREDMLVMFQNNNGISILDILT